MWGDVKNFVSTELHERLHTAVTYCGKGNNQAATPCIGSLILSKAPCSFALHTQPVRAQPRQLSMPVLRLRSTSRDQGLLGNMGLGKWLCDHSLDNYNCSHGQKLAGLPPG